jgi:hypothetical protein
LKEEYPDRSVRGRWLIFSFHYDLTYMINRNLFNRKALKSLGSSLRKNSTSAEAALWEMLKSKRLDGRKFRREYSVSNYIADQPPRPALAERDTPPSKGGESAIYELILYRTPLNK